MSGADEIDMEEDLIEARTFDIDAGDSEKVAGLPDVDLNEVSEQVSNIEEKIRSLFSGEDEVQEDQVALEKNIGAERQEVDQLVGTQKAPTDEPSTEQSRSANITPITSVKKPPDSLED